MRYNQETLLYSAVTPLFYCLSCNHFNRCLIFELGRYTLPLTSAFFLDIKVVCIVFIFIYNTKIKVIIELFLSFELVTRINFKDVLIKNKMLSASFKKKEGGQAYTFLLHSNAGISLLILTLSSPCTYHYGHFLCLLNLSFSAN